MSRNTKRELLRILEASRGESISGEELAGRLGISRAGVWKQIKALREAGYVIAAVQNRGYCLAQDNDKLSREGMLPFLEDPEAAEKILVFDVLDSTNTEAKRRAVDGAPDGTVILADRQTAGRGRLGRSFFSPAESGVYFTMLLRPEIPMEQAVLATTAASVAASRAVEKVTGRQPQIKWVNDLYLDGKKICGILTEAVSDFETGAVEAVVVGIGINCTTVFPEELQEKAGSVLQGSGGAVRNRLAAELVNQVSGLEQMIRQRTFLEEYRSRSMVIGKEITVLQEPGSRYFAEGIGQSGELILRDEAGNEKILSTGEVSIRLTE